MKFEIKDLNSMQLMICLEALGELGKDEPRGVLPTYQVEELTDDEALSIVSGDGPISTETRDAEGCLWDAETHSSSKAMNKDGTWKKKKVFAKEVPPPPAPVEVVQPVEANVPPPPAPVEVSAAADMTYAEFVKGISTTLAQGKSMSDFKEILTAHGYATISELRDKPELYQPMLFELQA